MSETPFEYRTLPTPSGVSSENPGSETFFGASEQFAVLPSAIFSVELFRGDAAFRPKDWAVRVTPVFNLNYVDVRERNVLNVSPEEGPRRRREDFALQEAFAEVKLFDVGANFDFVSVRAGIQPFTSDFRGFLFRDSNLGFRLFGTWGRNRNQWNIAYFDQLEKETNSELNLFERRKQQVVVANYFRQDFLTQGYTISPSVHVNLDSGEEFFYDANGFLVRPSPIGLIVPHKVKAYYAGFAGDGHWGRLNLTHQFYQVLGEDEFNGISSQKTDINAQFAAVELSFDKDWFRPRATVVWSSGDEDPDDDEARGFDAIADNPNIARRSVQLLEPARDQAGADRSGPGRPQQHHPVAAQQQVRRTGELCQPRVVSVQRRVGRGADAEAARDVQCEPAAISDDRTAAPGAVPGCVVQGYRARLQRRRAISSVAQRQRDRHRRDLRLRAGPRV